MYYHVIVETNETGKKSGQFKKYHELDRADLDEIIEDIVVPFLNKEEFQIDGYFIAPDAIKRLAIKETNMTSSQLVDDAYSKLPPSVFVVFSREDLVDGDRYATDITKESLKKGKKIDSGVQPKKSSLKKVVELDRGKVFIVHGHDDLAKTETARFIEKMNFEPVILHEQASSGDTIIEKIEKYSNVGFGVVLYTACDIGAKSEEDPDLQPRARQNVVFEHGFLNGKLGRKNVCALVKGNIETPNDIAGVVYVPMDDHGAWKLALAKEMRGSGYEVDMNKVI